jgi:uncharacterized protein YeaO (DUF488 family)
MSLQLSTYRYGEPRGRHGDVRIGCARLPVRGVRKEEYAARDIMDTEARQTIALLAAIAWHTPISLGCYCRTAHCHRFELERLVRAAASADRV